jgi:hypothetical protein
METITIESTFNLIFDEVCHDGAFTRSTYESIQISEIQNHYDVANIVFDKVTFHDPDLARRGVSGQIDLTNNHFIWFLTYEARDSICGVEISLFHQGYFVDITDQIISIEWI